MPSNIAGSIRKLMLDGISFRVAADSNFSEKGNQHEKENIPTSGDNMTKVTFMSQDVEGVVLMTGAAERESLRGLADRITDFPISYVTGDGSVYRTVGTINYENRETEENRSTIKLMPRRDWVVTVAN